MKIFEYKKDNNKLQIVCDSFETRSAWGHTAKLLLNGYDLGGVKKYYLNRTWERYTYQSVLLEAIRNAIDVYEYRNVEQFKDMNGIKRMTQKRKEEYKTFKGAYNEYIEFLQGAYEHFKGEY